MHTASLRLPQRCSRTVASSLTSYAGVNELCFRRTDSTSRPSLRPECLRSPGRLTYHGNRDARTHTLARPRAPAEHYSNRLWHLGERCADHADDGRPLARPAAAVAIFRQITSPNITFSAGEALVVSAAAPARGAREIPRAGRDRLRRSACGSSGTETSPSPALPVPATSPVAQRECYDAKPHRIPDAASGRFTTSAIRAISPRHEARVGCL